MEKNKIIAAFLVAGIVAMVAGFLTQKLMPSETLAENAFKVEVITAAVAGETPAAPAVAEPIKDLMASADIAQGEKLSKVCGSCHTFKSGEPARIGPNLFAIVGKARASAAGFAYSDAMKTKGGSWDQDSLNEFLWSPKAFVAGTKMTYAGLKKPADRAALIKWLEQNK